MDMGLEDDVCDTGLVLGLGYEGRSCQAIDRHRRPDPRLKVNPLLSNTASFEPSLTLALSDDVYGSTPAKTDVIKACEEARVVRQSSSQSTVSSFSNAYPSSVKREKDVGSDEDEEGSARKKLRLTKEQSALLEDRFKEHSTLNPKQKQALAKQLNLRPRQVEVWFQNRRARTKLKQTEVDCEFLKRCCQTLTDENRRLQKELQELKALNFSSPLYMQVPAGTLTMCPSCERVGGAGEGSAGGAFVVAPKPHFFNPFTHSAAC